MPFFPYFDPLYLVIVLPGVFLSLWASFKVKGAFARWSRVPARSGMSSGRPRAGL
jgi:Zn-dependent membrane protease YugP